MEYYVSCERRSTYVYLDVTAVPYIVTCSRNRDDGRIYAGISTNMHTAIAIPRIAKIYVRNTKQQSVNRVGSVCTASVPVNAVTKFLTSTDGAKLEKKYLYFGDTRISLYTQGGLVRECLHGKNSSIRIHAF